MKRWDIAPVRVEGDTVYYVRVMSHDRKLFAWTQILSALRFSRQVQARCIRVCRKELALRRGAATPDRAPG